MKSAILWSSASAVIADVTAKVEPSDAAPPAVKVFVPIDSAPEADTTEPLLTVKSAILWSSASAVIAAVTARVEPSDAAPPAVKVLVPIDRAPEADTTEPLLTVKSAILWSSASAVIAEVTAKVEPSDAAPPAENVLVPMDSAPDELTTEPLLTVKSAILWSSASAVIAEVTAKVEPSDAAPPAVKVLLPMLSAPEADTTEPLLTVKSAILWFSAIAVIAEVTASVLLIVAAPVTAKVDCMVAAACTPSVDSIVTAPFASRVLFIVTGSLRVVTPVTVRLLSMSTAPLKVASPPMVNVFVPIDNAPEELTIDPLLTVKLAILWSSAIAVIFPVTPKVDPKVAAPSACTVALNSACCLAVSVSVCRSVTSTLALRLIVSPVLFMFVPAETCPAPENCSNCRSLGVAPLTRSVFSPTSETSTKPWFTWRYPEVKNTNEPALISPDGSSLKFAHRRNVHPVELEASRKYTPLRFLSVCPLTRNRVATSSSALAAIGA